jgi:hypothetical protein
MEKQRQFQVLLLRHSRIKATSSLNPLSVEDELRPASSGIHPTVNAELKEVLTRVHHGRHFSHSSTISEYRFLLIPNQLNHIIFGFFFCPAAALPHWPDLEADRNRLPPDGWTWTISSLSSHSTEIIVRYIIKRKTSDHWHHFM